MVNKHRVKLFFLAGYFLVFLVGCNSSRQPESTDKLKLGPVCALEFPPPGEIKIPDYLRLELDNGMVIYLMEDRRFPLVNFYAKLSVGTINDPPEKLGLSELAMEVLRSGGTQKLSGDQIDQELERVGAKISTGISRDAGYISGYSLKADFSRVLEIFHAILTEPLFDREKFNLSRLQKIAAISRRDDQVRNQADREFRHLVYGKNHPYSRVSEIETVNNIGRDDLVDFYQKNIGPDSMVLAVWGDFEKQEMAGKIKNYFNGWPQKKLPQLPVLEITAPVGQVNLISRQGLTQSQLIIGHLGITRDHPDYFTLLVLSRVLGSGWSSRFMRYLRQEEALAYSLSAFHAANFAYPGLFIARAETRLGRTREALELIKREINRIRSEKISEQELNAAKEAVLNVSLFWFDTPAKVIERLARYQYYGYPKNYIDLLLAGVEAVTAEDLLAAAKKHLRPDELSFLIITAPEELPAVKDFLEN